MDERDLVMDDVRRFLAAPPFKPRSQLLRQVHRPEALCRLKYGKRIGAGNRDMNSGGSVTFEFCLPGSGCKPPLVAKVSSVNTRMQDITIDIDYKARLKIWSLRNAIPRNVLCPYGRFRCDGRELRALGLHLHPVGRYEVMVTDKCDETLLKLASNGIDKRAMAGLVFQVVFSLAMIRHYFPGFSHNDLHLKNVLYRKREAPLTYRYKDREYEITNPEYVAFINDFDFAQLPDVDDNPVVLFHRHRSNASDLFRFLYCIYSKGYPFKFIEKLIDPWLLRSELLHKYIYYTPVRGAFLSENPSPGSKLLMVAAQLMVSASDFERMMPNVYREIDARTILSLVYENYKTPIFSHK